MTRELLEKSPRIVVKVGSQVLCRDDGTLDDAVLVELVAGLAARQRLGQEVAFVSSGAVASGAGVAAKLGLGKQALAAIGQPLLMARYRELFAAHGIQVAQILLTHADLADRGRFLHARRVMAELMAAGVLPIINENDTVAVEELKFGDNDALAAQVAHVVGADVLVLLTETDGLYTANPHEDSSAVRIAQGQCHDDALLVFRKRRDLNGPRGHQPVRRIGPHIIRIEDTPISVTPVGMTDEIPGAAANVGGARAGMVDPNPKQKNTLACIRVGHR